MNKSSSTNIKVAIWQPALRLRNKGYAKDTRALYKLKLCRWLSFIHAEVIFKYVSILIL